MKLQRICIYPKDIQLITGKSERYGRELLVRVRAHYKKQPHQLVTVKEFCHYTGLDESEISPMIK